MYVCTHLMANVWHMYGYQMRNLLERKGKLGTELSPSCATSGPYTATAYGQIPVFDQRLLRKRNAHRREHQSIFDMFNPTSTLLIDGKRGDCTSPEETFELALNPIFMKNEVQGGDGDDGDDGDDLLVL